MEKKFKVERWQVIAVLMAIYDMIVVNLSYGFTLWLRFDFKFSRIPEWYRKSWLGFAPYFYFASYVQDDLEIRELYGAGKSFPEQCDHGDVSCRGDHTVLWKNAGDLLYFRYDPAVPGSSGDSIRLPAALRSAEKRSGEQQGKDHADWSRIRRADDPAGSEQCFRGGRESRLYHR